MAIKRDYTTKIPDSQFLYDQIGRRGTTGGGFYSGGEVPLGIPIGRADKPSKSKRFGISLGVGIATDLLNERQEPSIYLVVPKPVQVTKVIDFKTVNGQSPAPNQKELQVAAQQAQAQQAARVRMTPVALASPAQVACNY